jgi:hypothetical protein
MMRAIGLMMGLFTLPLATSAAAQLGTPTPEEAKLGRPGTGTASDNEPPKADPRDFSGMWKSAPMKMSTPPQQALASETKGAPPSNAYRAASRYCIPGNVLIASVEGGTEILQSADRITTVTEEQHNIRRIYIGQQHSVPLRRTVNGDSVAHWDGDTLVVETIGFQGYGVSPQLVRTEKWSKQDGGKLLVDEVSYRDPSGARLPPATTARFIWMPGTRVLEYICEDGSDEYMRKDYK